MQATTEMEQLLTAQELAEYLSVPLGTIYRWNSRGGGPPRFKFGNHTRYRRSAIEAWLQEKAA